MAYAEYGPPAGRPVLYHHGNPGSRLDLEMFGAPGQALLERRNLRVIAPDRPGVGRSTFQPGRQVRDWAADAAALADALGLERFALLSISSGSPFLAAAAQGLGERVVGAALMSPVAPLEVPGVTAGMGVSRLYFWLARWAPWLGRLQLRLMAAGVKEGVDPEKFAAQAMASFPPADRAAFSQPRVRDGFIATLRAALAPGPSGLSWDAGLLARPWGGPLDEIRAPIHIWHGGADTNAPPAMGRYLAQAIPGASLHLCPGEGHLSLADKYFDEILAALAV
ncbi:MAG: alpha/beta hydrolase [Anaerolineales bacterium]|nr:alpha/beta hydrolase [Anaerolineales bacterium]